jgi:hypothetical protein
MSCRIDSGASHAPHAHGALRNCKRIAAAAELAASRRCHGSTARSTKSQPARRECFSAPRAVPWRNPMKTEHAALRAAGASSGLTRRVDESTLAPEALIAVGAGYAALTRDGAPVFEAACGEVEHALSVGEAEALAAAEPDRDWRIHLVGPLDERHYRRRADGRWALYRRGHGLG